MSNQRAANLQMMQQEARQKQGRVDVLGSQDSYSEEEQNNQQNINFQQNNEGAQEEEQAVETEQVKPKRKVNLLTFKPENLMDDQKGLRALYENFDQDNLFRQGKNQDEVKFFTKFQKLDKLMKHLRSWHYMSMPKYDFNYFLERCQKFGTQPQMKAYLGKVRKVHAGDIHWDNIKLDEPKEDENPEFNEELDQEQQQIHKQEELLHQDEELILQQEQQELQQQQMNEPMEIEDENLQLLLNEQENNQQMDEYLLHDLQKYDDLFSDDENKIDKEDLDTKIKKIL